MLAVIIYIFEGQRSVQIFLLEQNPLSGEQVFKKTKHRYGRRAKIQPALIFLCMALLVVVALWGAVQAYQFTQVIAPTSNLAIVIMSGYCRLKNNHLGVI